MPTVSKWSVGIQAAVVVAVILVSMVVAPASLAFPDYVWGEASAMAVADDGLKGYWKYRISVGWDVTEYVEGAHGASHVSILLGLEECLADCGGACFVFADTVGVGGGEGGCNVYYYAELDLKGDPTIPPVVPTVKFEPYPDTCEPDVAGTAAVCFYSLIPPEPGESSQGSIWVKFGPYTEEGAITGMLPSCRGTVAYDQSTWSSIKRLFR